MSGGWALAIHGGAGLIRRDVLTADREAACRVALQEAMDVGVTLLEGGASAMDAVEAAVVSMEDCPLFNAGRGGVFTSQGELEFDAAVAQGDTRTAGAVAGARVARNPIRLARAVMEQTPHVMLVGAGADLAAERLGMELADASWFHTEERFEQFKRVREEGGFTLDHGSSQDDVYGTVGAVATDQAGHVAAATSTGGMVNKLPGRVGDSPLIGAGTWADDATCAVSATGHGEPMILLSAASRVAHLMDLLGLSLDQATTRVIHQELPALKGQGGLIACDAQGNVSMPFNTAGMFRGSVGFNKPAMLEIW